MDLALGYSICKNCRMLLGQDDIEYIQGFISTYNINPLVLCSSCSTEQFRAGHIERLKALHGKHA